MEAIYKYPLEVTSIQYVKMSHRARLLCVQNQDDVPTLWAVVNQAARLVTRKLQMFATGECADEGITGKYAGTVQLGAFVWHYFDMGEHTLDGK